MECVCRIEYDDMAFHCPTAVLTAYLVRGNVVSLWHSFVTTYLYQVTLTRYYN